MLGDHVLTHAHFNAKHHVSVFGHGTGCSFRSGIVDVKKFGDRKTRQARHGDVHKCKLACPCGRHDESTVGGEVVGASVASRHDRRCALVGYQLVSRYANCRSVGKCMAVQIYQARRNQSTMSQAWPVMQLFERSGDEKKFP